MPMVNGNLGDMAIRRYAGEKQRKPVRPSILDQNELIAQSEEASAPSGLQAKAEERGLGTAAEVKKKKKKRKTGLGAMAQSTYGV